MKPAGSFFQNILVLGAVAFTVFSLSAYQPLFAQAPQGGQAENQAAGVEREPAPVSGTLGQAGQKVGDKIQQFEARASRYLGSWIGSKIYADISWLKLLSCLLMILAVVTIERMARVMVHRKIAGIERVEGQISWMRLLLEAMLVPLSLVIWVYGIYGALSPILPHFASDDGSNLVHLVFQKAATLGGISALFLYLYRFINVVDVRLVQWAQSTESTIDDILVPLVSKTLRIFIIILAAIIIVQNLTGVEIGPLLASLGIGGVAIALAAKESIANFFGTLTILFDKPFQVGDRIIIDAYDGVVEHVGFRSTRIRLLTGHLVSIPNEKVISSGLENIGKRPYIRWLTNIGITYNTPPEKIQAFDRSGYRYVEEMSSESEMVFQTNL